MFLQVCAMKKPAQFLAVSSFVLILLQNAQASVKLGEIIPLCDAKDPNLNECVKQTTQKLFPHLREGIPDIGLQPLDPLVVPYMNMGHQNGPVYVTWQFNDTTHTGLTNGIVEDANIDMEKNVWSVSVLQPHYQMMGKYKVQGKILILPVNGNGVFNLTVTDIRIRLTLNLSKKMVDGKEYYNLDSTKYDITVTPGHQLLEMEGTDEFDKLGETFKKFMRENTDEIFISMKDAVEDSFSKMVTKYFKRMFDEVPSNEFFKNA